MELDDDRDGMATIPDHIGHECRGGPLDGERRFIAPVGTLAVFARGQERRLPLGALENAMLTIGFVGHYARTMDGTELVNRWQGASE